MKKAGNKVAGTGKPANSEENWEVFFSAEEEKMRAFERRLAMRDSLVEVWIVDIAQSLRTCEERQVVLGASEVSYVSWDTMDEPWQRGEMFFSEW